MAETLKGRKIYICATPQPNDLDRAGFEALTYIQIKGVGSIGQTGTNDNIVSYDEMDSDVLPKSKGISNAGDPPIELSRKATDNGQIAFRNAGLTKEAYAFKITDGDATEDFTPTTYYLRAIVGGPTKPNGRQENFDLETYVLGCIQRELQIDPEGVDTPEAVPFSIAIRGGNMEGDTLTVDNGQWLKGPSSFTYKWYRDDAGDGVFVQIAGETDDAYVLAAADVGNAVRAGVTGTNAEGSAEAFSPAIGLIAT